MNIVFLTLHLFLKILENYCQSNEWWHPFFDRIDAECVEGTINFLMEASVNMIVVLRRKLKEFSKGGKYENWKTDPEFREQTKGIQIDLSFCLAHFMGIM